MVFLLNIVFFYFGLFVCDLPFPLSCILCYDKSVKQSLIIQESMVQIYEGAKRCI